MLQNDKHASGSGITILLLVITNILILKVAFIQHDDWYWPLVITLPMLLLAILFARHKNHAIQRNLPAILHSRHFPESIQTELKSASMKTAKKQLIIAHEDYETLHAYIKGLKSFKAFDRKNADILQDELKKATIVKRTEIPADVVRLNSRVIIEEVSNNTIIELMLVLPEKADIKEKRVSVFAPLGTALIGFKQGEKFRWQVPSGNKTFTIIKVHNQ
ncbi:GreA/GreB family elongation factor [Flavihumibacter fluvii]|uniref:GreA/GreB family elongation factor n=1 Tax=Flavihumibacter fluvii TaxID=2838157 RepID=UPI001BDEF5E2|nr:GreA/GreB family elongation factor [Flavihumibacter fluvii]ULQ50912.1 GreA/GreB family elongation factor [Flavihumibacter fluvii]